MKTYHLYVFTQENCAPCLRLKQHVGTLTYEEQSELDYVPLRVASSCQGCYPDYTALALQFDVTQTPTLVVEHEEQSCQIEDGDEWCDPVEVEVEKIVGAKEIIKRLDATLDAYTYAHPDE